MSVGGSIAVVGDLHSAWEAEDIGYFNRSDYPAVLVTGDLGRSRSQDGRRIARALMHLLPEVLVMLGNNDVDEYPHLRAELTYARARADLLADSLLGGDSDTPSGAYHTRLCGYSLHPLDLNGLPLTVVAARPFSMGGPELAFTEALERLYGVSSMEASCARLRALVDSVTTEQIMFLAHNGPTGLGAQANAIWGRDFHPDAGDWGDPDLRVAVDYAVARGLRVCAVVAGHMHWSGRERSSHQRQWSQRENGILYVNAARVPRVFESAGTTFHHHVRLTVTEQGATAEECLIASD